MWLAAGVAMLVHIGGVLLLNWSWTGASWWVALFLLVGSSVVEAVSS